MGFRAVLAAGAALAVLLSLAGLVAAAVPAPSLHPEQVVYDPDDVWRAVTERTAESIGDSLAATTGIRLLLYAQRVEASPPAAETEARATTLLRASRHDPAVLLLIEVDESTCGGQAAFARSARLTSPALATPVLAEIVASRILPTLRACDPDTALVIAVNGISGPLIQAGLSLPRPSGATAAAATARPSTSQIGPASPAQAGPPFPDPEPGRYVYDMAGVFAPQTIATVQGQIQAIRDRTGAEIAVYSQVVDYGITTEETEAHARALMDQWGVGRRGFDDGLVILFDLDPSLVHGQVQLYAGPGYRATFLSNSERQKIFDEDMLPRLSDGDLDGALLIAMQKIDANATPEHAATLARARTINAVVGLVGAPVLFVLLVGWALWSWLRYGRDPYYLDDASILMPAPPPDLTAAAGALVMDGESSRHTLTTAMLDLASRDEIAFVPEDKRFQRDTLSIEVRSPDEADAQIALNRRKPISPAESYALARLRSLAEPNEEGRQMIESKELLKFGTHVGSFNERLENYVKKMGWYREAPSKSMSRWRILAGVELVLGIAAVAAGVSLPADGLVLLSVGLFAAAVVTFVIAGGMPARTLQGAVIKAMLQAYQRTLQKTLAQARSMNQVVASKTVPWLETPDQAVVWGVALGLRDEVQEVLERSISDLKKGVASSGTYVPRWYGGSGVWGGSSGSGGFGGVAPGLFSGSAIPDVGNMMSVLGTIGNSPSSSGSGGYGGGGSGGGGGGSGGGF